MTHQSIAILVLGIACVIVGIVDQIRWKHLLGWMKEQEHFNKKLKGWISELHSKKDQLL